MSGRPRYRKRAHRAAKEFLGLPLLVVGGLIALASITVLADRGAFPWLTPARHAVTALLPAQSTSTLLETVTPGLLTVISIIFFVLLMAIQHQSSTYTPVVLDQFVRRKGNQLFFGGFVGLSIYCLLTIAILPSGQAILSAVIVIGLCLITFTLLLVFVYSTIDQMRPSATMWMIQKIALRAYAHQRELLARCRARPQHPDTPRLSVTSDRTGYIVDIATGPLEECFRHLPEDNAEIHLHAALGDHLVPGGTIAEVHSHREDHRERMAEAVLEAITIARMREIDHDAGHAVEHLGSMAWSAAASSADPDGARLAVETLHSLLVSFENHDDTDRLPGRALPVVHNDRIISKTLDALTSIVAAAGISGQHQTYSVVLNVFSQALPQLSPPHQEMAIDRLQRALVVSRRQVFTVDVERGFTALEQATRELDMHNASDRLSQIHTELASNHSLAHPK